LDSGFIVLIIKITVAVNHQAQLVLELHLPHQAYSFVASSPQKPLALQVQHQFNIAHLLQLHENDFEV
jgi:hypothetical protein